MSLQGVFNTKLSEKIGLWQTNALVQGIGFIVAILVTFFVSDGSFRNLKYANKFYLLGGILGVIITFTVMKGISTLGTTLAIATILVAQLVTAALIDHFGFFGVECAKCGFRQLLGVLIMILGIVVFKWKG